MSNEICNSIENHDNDEPRSIRNYRKKIIQESGLSLPIHGSDCDDCQYRASSIQQVLASAERRWRRFMAEN